MSRPAEAEAFRFAGEPVDDDLRGFDDAMP